LSTTRSLHRITWIF